MSEDKKRVTVEGNKLACPVCKNETFWHRSTLLNTRVQHSLMLIGLIKMLRTMFVPIVGIYIGSYN